MAISTSVQGDYLDTWRENMREDIWRFNQVMGLGTIDLPEHVYLQVDRDMVGRALFEAVNRMTNALGYAPKPTWFTDEVHYTDITRLHREIFRMQHGYVQEIGKRATTLIETDAAIVYSNVGNVGIDDTATITVTTAFDADEIGVFFRVADGAISAQSDAYRIMPLTVTKNGNTATITGHRALFVKPAAYWARPYKNSQQLEPNIAATQDANDFVTLVDVCRVYADATQAVEIIAPPACASCDEQVVYGSARITDARLGFVQLCDLSAACPGNVERVKFNYYAGYPLQWGKMDAELANAMIRLANTLMNYCPTSMVDGNAQAGWVGGKGSWSDDNAEASIPANWLNNPFGVLKGQISAWRVVQYRALGRGGSIS